MLKKQKINKQKINKHQDAITNILSIIYLIVLVWVILMKTEFSFKDLHSIRDINFIPFDKSTIINSRISYMEIYLNILIFVPYGLYISMLKTNWSFIKKLIPIFLSSLLFETLQYIFAIGATDITDLIGNTLGGIIGIIFYFILDKLFKNRVKINKILNVLASISTISFILLAGVLILFNR